MCDDQRHQKSKRGNNLLAGTVNNLAGHNRKAKRQSIVKKESGRHKACFCIAYYDEGPHIFHKIIF